MDKQAGIMIRDDETKDKLVDTIIRLAADENRMDLLRKNILSLGKKNADEKIAGEVLAYIGKA